MIIVEFQTKEVQSSGVLRLTRLKSTVVMRLYPEKTACTAWPLRMFVHIGGESTPKKLSGGGATEELGYYIYMSLEQNDSKDRMIIVIIKKHKRNAI